jgi:hypothetical protein
LELGEQGSPSDGIGSELFDFFPLFFDSFDRFFAEKRALLDPSPKDDKVRVNFRG